MVLSPSLSLSDSFSLSAFLSFALSPCTLRLSPLFLPFRPPVRLRVPRATYHHAPPEPTRVRPRVLSLPSDVPAATCQSPSVVCLRAAARAAANRGIVGASGYFCDTPTGERSFGDRRSRPNREKCSIVTFASRRRAEMRTGSSKCESAACSASSLWDVQSDVLCVSVLPATCCNGRGSGEAFLLGRATLRLAFTDENEWCAFCSTLRNRSIVVGLCECVALVR